MDAEFLARAGADVIASDIAPEAAKRARARARRFGVALTPLVADAERLPFADRSVDVVYVHDGLHHLERPLDALREMARVARRAVSINEHARTAVTRAAVRVGLAPDRGDAGNRVERLDVDDVARTLVEHGFRVVEAARYGMVYRHKPGPSSRLLSRPPLLALTTRAFGAINGVAGRAGNKLTVQAVR